MLRTACGLAIGLAIGCAGPAEIGPTSRAAEPVAVPAPPEDVLRVAVVSDLNGVYGAHVYGEPVHGAIDRILELRPDVVLSTGDMVAGQRRGLDYDRMWVSFHAAVSDRLRAANIPFAVTPGNHDASGYPAFSAERAIYVREWLPRRPELDWRDDEHYPLRYSFRAGPALFVALDATTIGPLSHEQMAWLDEALREDAPVKIVFGHVPLYPFAKGREREYLGDAELEELLVRRGVDLFVSGHHHAYYPGRRGGLRLVSTACLGAGARPLLGTRDESPRSIVFFEVAQDGIRELDAFSGAAFDRRVERADLPPAVGEEALRIDRDDVVRSPLRLALP